ncbi:TROVE domain-containing protein [Streptomyces sp. NPDC056696]|uniref:TROVE domain-containing protein n=1 Tax=Streptomyces sp. NPDC056696 TaxID=3345914 RepID=UPI00367AED68
MARFNTRGTRPVGRSPIATVTGERARTHEGATGYLRDARSELFLLAVSNLVATDAFYESADDRDDRYSALVRQLAVEDPEWTASLLGWLRGEGNMRTAALVGAAEFVKARIDAGAPGHSRQAVDSVLQRADEPGELLGYWTSRYGRRLPKPVKRGIADAVQRLYNERCVTTNTLVLKRDLSWVRAGDLNVGDELVGFDEQVRSSVKGKASKMRVATVTATRRVMLPTVKVKTDKGESSVSVDHQFVISRDRKRAWRRAGDLKPGDKLIFFGEPWRQDHSRDAGWMAGFLDGEGSVTQKCVQVSQVVGETCEYAKEVLKRLGFEFSVQQYQAQGNRQLKETLKILGGRYESMRLLGTVGGVRLSRDRLWLDGDLVSKGRWVEPGSAWATVESVDDLGLQENVTMGTSTKTFISDGFLSHNSLLKYDTDSKGYRFGDVLNLAHPAPATGKPWQGDLFRHALDRRHGNTGEIPERLRTLRARERLIRVPVEERHAVLTTDTGRLAEAAMTWESLAGWLQRPMDAAAWEAIIPSMGLMALARNLRNFDEAGVSDEVAQRVAARFADADEVRRSRMFPFRFWAAYKHAPSLRWGHALERALAHSLAGVPTLPGRSLILVDRSPSMFPGYGFSTPHRSDIPPAEQAAVFGAALAMRAEIPTLVEFGMDSRRLNVRKGGSVLPLVERFGQISGTDIPTAVKKHLTGHDRVVVVTDEQTRPGWFPSNARDHGGMAETEIDVLVPRDVPVYMWNMAGYKVGATPSGGANRHAFGGLTDQAFRLIPLIERGGGARWPWEK